MSNETSAKLERILIATDGSQQAKWATRFGRQLAVQLGAKVLLLHVVVPSIPTSGDFETARRLEEVRREFGLDLLGRTRRSLPVDMEVYSAQRTGLPSEEIAAEARAWRADLVILGTHGQGRLARLVLGSTADAVIRQAPCPVITISHEPTFDDGFQSECAVADAQTAGPVAVHVEHAAADE
jgi:nucleotide-binding universal stress UspA family protein